MYGRSNPSALSGILYLLSLSHSLSPAASVADRITIWYSCTSNFASTLTALIWTCLVARPAELAHVSVTLEVASSVILREVPGYTAPTPWSTVQLGVGHGSF